jgi:hypothetical protein
VVSSGGGRRGSVSSKASGGSGGGGTRSSIKAAETPMSRPSGGSSINATSATPAAGAAPKYLDDFFRRFKA